MIVLCLNCDRGVFTMRSLAFTGVALAALIVSHPVRAQTDSRVGAPPLTPPVAGSTGTADQRRASITPISGATGTADQRSAVVPVEMAPMMGAVPRRAVRRLEHLRPSYGFQLPQEWMSDEYAVDYRDHGLDRPARGYGWSRYHDDIVLTDQWGRVYDVAGGYDRAGGNRERDTEGLAGGVAGAAVGAVAGNVIAGAGSRLAGSLIGGGVGALAGLAVERAISRNRQRGPRYDDRAHGGAYERGGHWSGSEWGGQAAHGSGLQACGCGGETVTTTTVTYHGGGGGYMAPREVVTYENAYAPVRTKYRPRAVSPAADGKTRVRTRLHTKTY